MTANETRLYRALLRLTRYAKHALACPAFPRFDRIYGDRVSHGRCDCGLDDAKAEFARANRALERETRERRGAS